MVLIVVQMLLVVMAEEVMVKLTLQLIQVVAVVVLMVELLVMVEAEL